MAVPENLKNMSTDTRIYKNLILILENLCDFSLL